MGLPRSSVAFPIKLFVRVSGVDIVDVMNALVNDFNRYLSIFVFGIPINSSTLALLPASALEGTELWVSDGMKIGEVVGAGTGIWAYYSLGSWRAVSTDAPLTADPPPTDSLNIGLNITVDSLPIGA